MLKYLKALIVMMLILIVSNCASGTLANYSLQPLSKRHLRISLDGPWTEYRWYSPRKCGPLKLFTCLDVEHIEKDFDFTKRDDREKFLKLGFDCSVRERS